MVSRARAFVGFVLILFGAALLMPLTSAVDKAPDVELTDVDGVTFRLSDYAANDTVLVLDFMFITCPPCNILAKDLAEMYEDDDRDYEILSIDNNLLESSEELKDHAEKNGHTWRFTMDNDDNEAFIKYAIKTNPTIVIIDKEGYQTFRESGSVSIDDISKEIDLAISGEAEAIDPAQQVGLVLLAFLSGLAAFFSPCSFPLLPGYITYYFKVGADAQKKRQEAGLEEEGPSGAQQARTGLKLGTVSGLGIVLVYLILGVLVIGALLLGVNAFDEVVTYLKPIVGIILVIMGILTLLDIAINTGYITAPFRRLKDKVMPRKGPKKPSFDTTGLFLYGVGYGSASASCSAPIFIVLAFAAVSTGRAIDAVLTLSVFLFSLWLLMAVVSVVLTMSEERVKSGMMKHYIWIKRVTGVVFVVAGAYLLYLFLESEGFISI